MGNASVYNASFYFSTAFPSEKVKVYFPLPFTADPTQVLLYGFLIKEK